MRKFQLAAVSIVALFFIVAFFAQPMLPDRVASHWNIRGEVDGYMDRAFGAFFMPVLSLALLGLFYLLPAIDPLKKNYQSFQAEYDGMAAVFVAFFFYIYLITIAANLGYQFNMMQALSPAFGVLFIYLSVLLAKAKQNWFVGIRTPWTLASENVWDKTHALAGKLFRGAGFVALLGAILPDMLIASVAVVIATFVYSYLEFSKENARNVKRKGKRK